MPQETQQEGPGQFSGFVAVNPAPMDFVAGSETGILDAPRNNSRDWTPEVPDFKCQLMKGSNGQSYGDTNACVSFSATNDLAIQLDWLIANGQIDPNGVNFLQSNGYIGADGKVNLAPRFTAKMSGTNPSAGNSLPAVWNSLRHDGAVPESKWPMPTADFDALIATNSFNAPQDFWGIYYQQPSQEAIALGKQFASWFDVQYEWIAFVGAEKTMDQLDSYLNVAPLHIATAVCTGWNTANPIQACGDGAQHATTMIRVEPATAYDILDHYNPFIKRFAPQYSISYAMRGVIASKAQVPVTPPAFQYTYTVNLTFGAPAGAEVHALQQGLQTAKDKTGAPYMTPGVFGPFGPQTLRALARFQVDNGIADEPQQGHDFGPRSRAALTKALADLAFKASGEPIPRPLNPDAHRPN